MTTDEILEGLRRPEPVVPPLASCHHGTAATDQLQELLGYLAYRMVRRLSRFTKEDAKATVLDPAWSRSHPDVAGQYHADLILETYGPTYALPNKDPQANAAAIRGGTLDVYFLLKDGTPVGTACLSKEDAGFAELGRAAGRPGSGSSLILDLRIVHWLTDDVTCRDFHTLFTTLRSAPNRPIDDTASTFEMPGGQAVTRLWDSLPRLRVYGAAPLYLKHGALEQFVLAAISRKGPTGRELFINSEPDRAFVRAWLSYYKEALPTCATQGSPSDEGLRYEAHVPADDPDLAGLVHADVVPSDSDRARPLADVVEDLLEGPSPFVQVSVPIDTDTRRTQQNLNDRGFIVFGFDPSDRQGLPALLFGRADPRWPVVPTYWDADQKPQPYWLRRQGGTAAEAEDAGLLQAFAAQVSKVWRQG